MSLTFADTIRMARLSRRWSQAQMARMALDSSTKCQCTRPPTVDQSLISRLEHRRVSDPSAHLVKHLAIALELEVNDLIEMIGTGRL